MISQKIFYKFRTGKDMVEEERDERVSVDKAKEISSSFRRIEEMD